MRGDWAFALKAGIEASGGIADPPTNELWAIPLDRPGTAVRVAAWRSRGLGTEAWNSTVGLRKAFAPDGKRIVISAGQAVPGDAALHFRLAVLDIETGAVRVVGPDIADYWDPSWSPDGARIAFVRHERGQSRDDGVWSILADGSARRMTAAPSQGSSRTFAWSPDSGLVLVGTSGGQLASVDAASGQVIVFASGSWFTPTMLLSGDQIAFSSGRTRRFASGRLLTTRGLFEIAVGELRAGSDTVLFTHPDSNIIVDVPRWNPKTEEVLYRVRQTVRTTFYHVVTVKGGPPLMVGGPSGLPGVYLAEWTPDGSGIVYLQQVSTNTWHGQTVRMACLDGMRDAELANIAVAGLSDLFVLRYQ